MKKSLLKKNLLKKISLPFILAGMSFLFSCHDHSGDASATDPSAARQDSTGTPSPGNDQPANFQADVSFLRQHDSVIVLQADQGRAQVVVSPKYQGKVFTSTAEGDSGQSFGWIHYKAFSGPVDGHMNAYGGENRIWLGPEGGRFSLFFPKGAEMTFANWKTPAAFDTEAWDITGRDDQSVSLKKDMQLVNYAGTALSISVARKIRILDRQGIGQLLHLAPDSSVKAVGYQTENILTNTGRQSWDETSGMPCIWILDMFNPSPATVTIVPYKEKADAAGSGSADGSVATTDYFGEIPPDRIKLDKGILYFKADGKSRGKLGIHPPHALRMAGSYDAQHHVLTVTSFETDPAGKYLNQEWKTTKPPFSGDAVNAYNDGPLADGSQMGPFYEIESVSPAAFLAPGKSLSHQHAVFHFTGDEAGLDKISRQLLGVSLDSVKAVFPK